MQGYMMIRSPCVKYIKRHVVEENFPVYVAFWLVHAWFPAHATRPPGTIVYKVTVRKEVKKDAGIRTQ